MSRWPEDTPGTILKKNECEDKFLCRITDYCENIRDRISRDPPKEFKSMVSIDRKLVEIFIILEPKTGSISRISLDLRHFILAESKGENEISVKWKIPHSGKTYRVDIEFRFRTESEYLKNLILEGMRTKEPVSVREPISISGFGSGSMSISRGPLSVLTGTTVKDLNGSFPITWRAKDNKIWLDASLLIDNKKLADYDTFVYRAICDYLCKEGVLVKLIDLLCIIMKIKHNEGTYREKKTDLYVQLSKHPKVLDALLYEILPFVKAKKPVECYSSDEATRMSNKVEDLFVFNERTYLAAKSKVAHKKIETKKLEGGSFETKSLEGSERQTFDETYMALELLSFYLQGKRVEDYITELENKFKDEEKGVNDLVQWEKLVLNPFNRKHGIRMERISIETHFKHRKYELETRKKKSDGEEEDEGEDEDEEDGDGVYLVFPQISAEYVFMFKNSLDRVNEIRKHLMHLVKTSAKEICSGDVGVKLVLSVPKEKVRTGLLNIGGYDLVDSSYLSWGLDGILFGMAHAHITIGNVAVHWGDGAIVWLKNLDYKNEFCCVQAVNCFCPLIVDPTTIEEIFRVRIARFLVNQNSKSRYSKFRVKKLVKSKKDKNCHEFSMDLLSRLNFSPFYDEVADYLDSHKSETMKQANEEELKDGYLGDLRYVKIPAKLYGSSVKGEILKMNGKKKVEIMTRRGGSQKWTKEDDMKCPFRVEDNREKLARLNPGRYFSSATHYKIFFKTHRDLDALYNILGGNNSDFKLEYPGLYQVMKGFDRAFWIQLVKVRDVMKIIAERTGFSLFRDDGTLRDRGAFDQAELDVFDVCRYDVKCPFTHSENLEGELEALLERNRSKYTSQVSLFRMDLKRKDERIISLEKEVRMLRKKILEYEKKN